MREFMKSYGLVLHFECCVFDGLSYEAADFVATFLNV